MKRLAQICLACCFLSSAPIHAAAATPSYNIVPLGLDGLEHTSSDGYKRSEAYTLSEAGQVIGQSDRYNSVSSNGYSAWLYDGATTINVGLTGAEHTRSDDYKLSGVRQLNEAGQATGYSIRYNGGTHLGQSAWLYDGATTFDIGLIGAEHTRNDGYKSSSISVPFFTDALNEAGQVLGYSTRYQGNFDLGQSAWLYNGTTTVDIGLTDSEHTRGGGNRFALGQQLNEAGQVRGYSERYEPGSIFTDSGRSAWLYNGSTTINIGLTGPEYTGYEGDKYSTSSDLNEAGHVIGVSNRYSGEYLHAGQTTWIYNGVTTTAIGFTGSEYTRSDGYRSSTATQLNEAGQVRGYSLRYNGSFTFGRTEWLYDGATTIEVGFSDNDHTRSDGYKFSASADLNNAAQVIGLSYRYNGGTNLGQSAWLYDGASTFNIGLTDSEHTRAAGYKHSTAEQLNEAGQVVGYSWRTRGQSAWLYDGATTIDIGLTGPEYTRDDDEKYSKAQDLNEAGQVIGYSNRFNGGDTQLGQHAWFYDPLLNQTFAMNLSTRSDGYAYSSSNYLGADGLVLGTYTLFDALDNDLGFRAFSFTTADGLHDLGALVDGGLAANGWDSLANAIRANGLGQILGSGKLTSQSGGQMAYLLTPIIPEPPAFLLVVLNLLFAAARSPHRPQSARCGGL